MKKQQNATSDVAVLEVKTVIVKSGHMESIFDQKAVDMLQKSGFIRLKATTRGMQAQVPENEGQVTFLLQCSRRSKSSFTLYRIGVDKIIEIEEGYVVYYPTTPTANTLEVACRGYKVSDWEITCVPEKENTVQRLAELKRRLPIISLSNRLYQKPSGEAVTNGNANGFLGPEEDSDLESSEETIPQTQYETTERPADAKTHVESETVSGAGPEVEPEDSIGELLEILVSEIVVFQSSPDEPQFSSQPRKYFDPDKLQTLGNSLKTRGQKEPITVAPFTDPKYPGIKYELVNGERRFRATKLAGLQKVVAIVKKYNSKQAQHLDALILNFCKEGHTVSEQSEALQAHISAGMTVSSLAEAIGKTRTEIYKLLSLQKLHPNLRPILDPPTPKRERMSLSQGAILSRIRLDKQEEIWEQAKHQPTRELVVRKMHELGKDFFETQSVYDRKRNDPCEVSRRVSKNMNFIASAVMGFKSMQSDEWGKYASYRGYEQTAADIVRLHDLINELTQLEECMTRTRETLKQPATPL